MVSLQDRCLQIIIDEFERYHKLYSTTDDGCILRKFEYLQRKHSEYMLEHLHTRDEIKEEYIDFLMNKYLKVIDTQWFKNCSWSTVCSKFKEIGSTILKLCIKKLYIEGYSQGPTWQDIISCLPNLQFFSFPYYCHDAILMSIAKFCPNILEINVENSNVTNEGMKYLCMKNQRRKRKRRIKGKNICSRLKKLSITSTPVNDVGVKQLIKSLPSLEIIDYPNLPQVIYSIHKNNLMSLDKVVPYNIVKLDFLSFSRPPFFADILNVCFSVCPNLKDLACPLLTEEHLKFFSKLSDLEILYLRCFRSFEIDISALLKSKGSKLTSLTAAYCLIYLPLFSQFCPQLKNICLNQVTFLYDDSSKPVFHHIESCTFEYLNIHLGHRNPYYFLLSSCPKLVSLVFRRCIIICPEIEEYILQCCVCNPIENIIFLNSLVKGTFVKDIILSCRSLKKMHLDACEYESIVSEAKLKELAATLPNNPCITFNEELCISDDDDSMQISDGFDNDFDDHSDSDYYDISDVIFQEDYYDYYSSS